MTVDAATFDVPLEALFDRTAALVPKVDFYTGSTTWTKPANALLIAIRLVAKGGDGGDAGGASGGGGGSSGEIIDELFPADQVPETLTVVIGPTETSVSNGTFELFATAGVDGGVGTSVGGDGGSPDYADLGGKGGSGDVGEMGRSFLRRVNGGGGGGDDTFAGGFGGGNGGSPGESGGGKGGPGYGAGGGGGGKGGGGGGGGRGWGNAVSGQDGSGATGGGGALGCVVITTWRGKAL